MEVATDQGDIDAPVNGCGVESQQPAFAIAHYSHLPFTAGPLTEPVNGRQNFLHFVADDVPAHMKSLAVDPLAVSLVCFTEVRVPRPTGAAVDQHGDEHFESVLRQSTGELGFRLQTGREAGELFGSLAGIRQGYS